MQDVDNLEANLGGYFKLCFIMVDVSNLGGKFKGLLYVFSIRAYVNSFYKIE